MPNDANHYAMAPTDGVLDGCVRTYVRRHCRHPAWLVSRVSERSQDSTPDTGLHTCGAGIGRPVGEDLGDR